MRRPAALTSVAVLVASGALVAGCSSQGAELAQRACVHVERSIALYQRSLRTPSAATAAADRQQAGAQLELAEPLAAAANSSDGTWNGLMTTIGESARVPEAELIGALRSQCLEAAGANAPPPVPGPPAPGPTAPPGTVTPGTVTPGTVTPAG